jgi:lauroyl/myristoyl acyltransferase
MLHLRREYIEKQLETSRIILADGPPERPLELLRSGESVGVAFDVAGSASAPFLGRSVVISGGPATMAFQTKAMVLPVIAERRGIRFDVRLLPPIDSAEYRDPRSLRVAIARTFEPIVLAKPEAVELFVFPHPLVTEAPHTFTTEYLRRRAAAL